MMARLRLALLALAIVGGFCPPARAEEDPEVSDEGTRRAFLAELNALADAGKTKTAAALLEEKPASSPDLALAGPGTETLDGPALYRRLREGTVIVGSRYKCKKCAHWHLSAASGFLISADGAVVTNRHVLANPDLEAMAVMDGAGKAHAILGLLAEDAAHDVVLLRIEGSGYAPLALARGATPPGTEVAVMSHPNSRFWLFTTGVVARVAEWVDAHAKPPGRFAVLCITAPFAPGSSGAPVTDRQGNVVGIAQRIMPILQAKEQEPQPQQPQGEYTAMVIPMAVPVRWVRALASSAGE